MAWMEDGCYWGSEEGSGNVAGALADRCSGYGTCIAEYVLFDCEIEISLAGLLFLA